MGGHSCRMGGARAVPPPTLAAPPSPVTHRPARLIPPAALQPGLAWSLAIPGGLRVSAAQLQHRVPCWGYVFREPHIRAAPAAEDGAGAAGVTAGAEQQPLGPPTGQHEAQQEAGEGAEAPAQQAQQARQAGQEWVRRGRKLVVLGDTCDSRAIAPLAMGCDLLSHEATFCSGGWHAGAGSGGRVGGFEWHAAGGVLVGGAGVQRERACRLGSPSTILHLAPIHLPPASAAALRCGDCSLPVQAWRARQMWRSTPPRAWRARLRARWPPASSSSPTSQRGEPANQQTPAPAASGAPRAAQRSARRRGLAAAGLRTCQRPPPFSF